MLFSALAMLILSSLVVVFYDDFGFPIGHVVVEEGLSAKSLATLLGVVLKLGKKAAADNDSFIWASAVSPRLRPIICVYLSRSRARVF